jgi:putative ABC transport system permease protein
MARQSAQHRLTMLMLGSFGVLGAVIAEIGIFGLMAYVVAQRTREVGVRMALGAIRSRVMAMVMSKALTLVSASVILGSAGAWYLSTTAKTFLFALEAHDPRAFTGVLATLALTALPASAIPARRARSVDPIVALRSSDYSIGRGFALPPSEQCRSSAAGGPIANRSDQAAA